MRHNFKKIVSVALLQAFSWSYIAIAETFEAKLGGEQTTVVSSIYQTAAQSTIQAEATYSRPLTGRWSILAQYQTNVLNTLSAGIGGLAYDSDAFHTKGGAIANDGTAEISRVPIWIFRAGFGVGLFKYVDVLKSNNASLGNRNAVPVQADLYGLKFAGTLMRLMSDDWGLTTSASYTVASADNFGISSTCFSLGVIYRHN